MDTKNLPKWSPKPPKSTPEGTERAPGRPKNPKKKQTQHKAPFRQIGSPYFDRKSGQHGSKLVSKLEGKSKNNLCKNRSEK